MKFNKVIILGAMITMLSFGCKSEAQEVKQKLIDKSISELKNDTEKELVQEVNFVEGELLIGFDEKAEIESFIQELENYEGVTLVKMLMDEKDARIAQFKVPKGEEQAFITVFSRNKNIDYAELNKKGTFISPIVETQSSKPKVENSPKNTTKQSLPQNEDKIVGIWEVKNDYYMAVYEIQKYKGKYIGLVHYYNDGKDEVKGDGSKKYYFLENVVFKNDAYVNGKMHMPDGTSHQVIFKLKNDNQLEAAMTLEGHPYSETWTRKLQ